MEQLIKVVGEMTCSMVMACTNGQMVENTHVIGRIITFMAMESSNGLTVDCTQVDTKTNRCTDTASINGQMVRSTKVIGKMVLDMDRVD